MVNYYSCHFSNKGSMVSYSYHFSANDSKVNYYIHIIFQPMVEVINGRS